MGPGSKEADRRATLTSSLNSAKPAWLCVGLMLAVLAAYANHFQNAFHFDDAHTIVNNVAISRVRNIPRFFADPTLFSSVPEGRTWRPLVSTSLAIDYRLGHGLKPFYFHLSTFIWLNVQLVLMFFLFRRIMNEARPGASNTWTALAAAACYGLHPANAETVNYIIQRGDLYDTLGVVAGLLWFAAYPRQRRWGWYLVPAMAAYFSKAPALVFPLVLLAYVFLFEQEAKRNRWTAALRAAAPAFVVTAVFALLTAKMTPADYDPGSDNPLLYRVTQPWVALHYFKCFFLPTDLSADSDWTYVTSPFSAAAIAGYAFVAVIVFAGWRTARARETRPIAFGLLWFLFALLPTSLLPLADVTNDHRMFFPFVGLALAVFWSLRLLLLRRRRWMYAAVPAMAGILFVCALGTRERNRVWRTEESLWRDVTIKSPQNGRGLMNYAIVLMERHEYAKALPYLQRSAELRPDYPNNEVNLALAYAGLGRGAEAEQHFRRGLKEAPESEETHVRYATWLRNQGRLADARKELEAAIAENEGFFGARDLLSCIYGEEGNAKGRADLLKRTLRLALHDQAPTPEAIVNVSAEYCRRGDYERCLVLAKAAAELRPGWAEPYNQISAARLATAHWNEAIAAAREALRLRPDSETARTNLDFALAHGPERR